MKKNVLRVALAIFGLVLVSSCTDNTMARKYGGTETIELEKNQVVIGGSWKGEDLWILTKDTVTNECIYQETSKWGLLEGQIKFKSKQ